MPLNLIKRKISSDNIYNKLEKLSWKNRYIWINMFKEKSIRNRNNYISTKNFDISSFLNRNKIIIFLGISMVFGLLIFMFGSDMRRDTNRLELFFFIPFTIYLGTIFWIYKTQKNEGKFGRKYTNQKVRIKEIFFIIIFFALIFRVIFLFSEPLLSDDVYRYYWEGKISNQGINPYLYAPDSMELEEFKDSEWENVHNKYNPTCYPPVSQITFSICYLLYPSIYTFKIFFTIFDILSIYVIFLLLKNFKLDIRYSIIYAWSPLVIIEFAHNGHNDSLVIFLLLLSFLFLQKNNKKLSSVAIAMAFLTKFYPIIFVPLLLKKWGKKNTMIFFVIVGLFYLPFIKAGRDLVTGMNIYIKNWMFNGSIFPILIDIIKSFHFISDPIMISKIIIFTVFGILLLFLTLNTVKNRTDTYKLLKYSFILTGFFILLNPTVHPWYIIWIIPFLCFFRFKSWILLSGTVILSYYVYIDFDILGIWAEKWWIRVVEYLPFYIILIYEIYINRKLLINNKDKNSIKKYFKSEL